MRKLLMLPVFAFFFSYNSQAQKIKIRQSFQSEDTKPEPAAITYTHPKDKQESFLVDAALGISAFSKTRKTLTGYAEYHRNTLVDAVSNTLQAGAAYELHTNPNYLSGENRKINGSTSIINLNGKYSNDKVNSIQSLQASGEITLLFAPGLYPKAFLPNYFNQIGNLLAIEYFPSAGFEYEGRIKTGNDSTKGNIARGMGKIYLSIYPLSKLLNNQVELFSNFSYRYDVINTTLVNDRSHPSVEAGINFIFYKKDSKRLSLCASYNNIDNPASGQVKQNFWLVAFKVKI